MAREPLSALPVKLSSDMVWTSRWSVFSSLSLSTAHRGWPTVLDVELDTRAVGGACQPDVQVLALPGLKEHDAVAIVELGNLVQKVQMRLCIELGIFARVRHHRNQVRQQLLVAVCDTAGAEDEDPRLGLDGLVIFAVLGRGDGLEEG